MNPKVVSEQAESYFECFKRTICKLTVIHAPHSKLHCCGSLGNPHPGFGSSFEEYVFSVKVYKKQPHETQILSFNLRMVS